MTRRLWSPAAFEEAFWGQGFYLKLFSAAPRHHFNYLGALSQALDQTEIIKLFAEEKKKWERGHIDFPICSRSWDTPMNRQALLFIQVDAHTLSLWVCIAALLLSHLNKPFIYELSHLLLCYVSNNKFCICIYKKKKRRQNSPFLSSCWRLCKFN